MSLVLGLLSVLCCGILAPFAIITSLFELKSIKSGDSSPSGKGFTIAGLILGIFGLLLLIPLICISIPGYMAAQHRSIISRSKADLQVIEVALESYYVDHQSYPGSINELTTPVAYLNKKLTDPFSSNREEPYFYYAGPDITSKKTYFFLAGRGPDGKLGINGDTSQYKYYVPDKNYTAAGIIVYDPTNGTTSDGDIIFPEGPDTTEVLPEDNQETGKYNETK